ncbi:MAG: Uma2 family endonuclease [Eubacteriales bacterium]|nr:Uma2 family endonuclease [Eubacteriales bacterium]
MDYRDLVGTEQADPGEMLREAEEDTLYRKKLLERGPDPDKVYTIEDFRQLPEGFRAELVDGKLFFMESPSTLHQEIVGELYFAVAGFVKSNGGSCRPFIAPYDVYLNGDESRILEPDLIVVCEPDKIREHGCCGAPDWVVEVTSPSTRKRDLGQKLFLYREAGVREYWLINPTNRVVIVYVFELGEDAAFYSFEDEIRGHVFPAFRIRLSDVV